jgi:hypothetical protein
MATNKSRQRDRKARAERQRQDRHAAEQRRRKVIAYGTLAASAMSALAELISARGRILPGRHLGRRR